MPSSNGGLYPSDVKAVVAGRQKPSAFDERLIYEASASRSKQLAQLIRG